MLFWDGSPGALELFNDGLHPRFHAGFARGARACNPEHSPGRSEVSGKLVSFEGGHDDRHMAMGSAEGIASIRSSIVRGADMLRTYCVMCAVL